jgi:3,4-dihydroxy 2-butanone 4-phosphate synthase / GTP cyclohydrolase II
MAKPSRQPVRRAAEAFLPTDGGARFRAIAYEEGALVHVALVHGEVNGAAPVLVRLHSKCLTGDVFGSSRCDCGPQLRQAIERISSERGGVIVYLDHEGRGIGLVNKLRAYALQERGLDTVSANECLGFAPDLRDYTAAAEILQDVGAERVRLLTNNPDKVRALERDGIEVVCRVPIEAEPGPDNVEYLRTKRDRMEHLLSGLF